MVVSVFTPNGIVVATASYDSFYNYIDSEDGTLFSPIHIEGLPHTYTFWGQYSLTFNTLNQYVYESPLLTDFAQLSNRWDSIPPIFEFMPYLKKLIMEKHFHLIGVMAAYNKSDDGLMVPYVYQILGESIRRINLDNDGKINYNCVYLEKNPHIGKLLQKTKLQNGEQWEENPATQLRCDLFSISKSIDLCRFMLRTSHYVENINSAMYDIPLKADVSIITEKGVETQLLNI